MSDVPRILPKPPQVSPGAADFNGRWQKLNKWYTDLVQSLQRGFAIIGADFDAIQTPYAVNAGPFPIVVAGTPVVLGSAVATIRDVTQMVMVVGNIEFTVDAGNDPVFFYVKRGSTQIALDYMPATTGGLAIGKTVIAIDSVLQVGQYRYQLLAQTGGAAGNTDVTAAKVGALVI